MKEDHTIVGIMPCKDKENMMKVWEVQNIQDLASQLEEDVVAIIAGEQRSGGAKARKQPAMLVLLNDDADAELVANVREEAFMDSIVPIRSFTAEEPRGGGSELEALRRSLNHEGSGLEVLLAASDDAES